MNGTVRMETVGDRVIVFRRAFQAHRELVFQAWTVPALLTRWYGARGWRLVECEVDLRVGGAYRFVSRGPGGAELAQSGVYQEVVAPCRLVFTERFDHQSYPGESLIAHEFAAEAGDRSTVTSTIMFPSAQAREQVLRYPMARGLAESYQHLDLVLRQETGVSREMGMNWTLEVVVVPVSDLDRAKSFYADQLGFQVDHDTSMGEQGRLVQLTPPGSGCSIVIGSGVVPQMPPGSLKGLQLVVGDVRAAREELVARGVAVSDVQVLGENPTPQPDPLDNVGFIFFEDPDGNAWGVQQISSRK